MATMTYKEQLQHPNWQRKRLEALESARFECENCGDKETMLHVHHKQYFKGRMAWEYDASELTVLCEPCHGAEHEMQAAIKSILALTDTNQNMGLLAGFHDQPFFIDQAALEEARKADALAYAAGFCARIIFGLDVSQMLAVARYAASLHNESAEARMIFEHCRGNTFGEGS